VSELDRRIADLQAANRREDAATTELRAAIQREQDQLPILRQRADAQLASLQAQVAHLVNQSRALTRQIADAKRESASLRALTEQYKQELEEPSPLLVPMASETGEPMAPTPSSTVSPGSPVNPAVPPQQTARIAPVAAPQPSIPPPPAQINPDPVDDSWTGMIMSWLSSLWSLIFG
jgi:septal ring factor EnvC (AmiA/AmiB activator)